MPLTRAVAAECEVEGRGAPELPWVRLGGRSSEYEYVIKMLQRTDGFDKLAMRGACCNSMLNADNATVVDAVVSSHRDHDTLCRMAQPPSAVPMPISHFLVRPVNFTRMHMPRLRLQRLQC